MHARSPSGRGDAATGGWGTVGAERRATDPPARATRGRRGGTGSRTDTSGMIADSPPNGGPGEQACGERGRSGRKQAGQVHTTEGPRDNARVRDGTAPTRQVMASPPVSLSFPSPSRRRFLSQSPE